MDDPNMNAYGEGEVVKRIPLLVWLGERKSNCERIAELKDGIQRLEWLDDAKYFEEAMRLTRERDALLDALKQMSSNCFSAPESRLSLMVGNGPAFSNPENENSIALHKRCDRVEKAFALAEAAIALCESPQPKKPEETT